MKVLFISSNPEDSSSLNLVREFTALQQRTLGASPEPITLVFKPDLPYELLAGTLNEEKPDILHIAAHCDDDMLHLADYRREKVEITGEMLGILINRDSPPILVYLNSCNSTKIAEDLRETVPVSIGSNSGIANAAARSAAVAFYDRLIEGETIHRAYEVGNVVLNGASKGRGSLEIFEKSGFDSKRYVLHRKPNLYAIVDKAPKNKHGVPNIDVKNIVRFGLCGCPASVRQVIFFTDSEEFLEEGKPVENSLCLVVRRPPISGAIWLEEKECWGADTDFRLYAVATFGDGKTFTASSLISDAISRQNRDPQNPRLASNLLRGAEDPKHFRSKS